MKKLLIALSAFAAVSLTLASEKFDLWPEGKMPGKSAAGADYNQSCGLVGLCLEKFQSRLGDIAYD